MNIKITKQQNISQQTPKRLLKTPNLPVDQSLAILPLETSYGEELNEFIRQFTIKGYDKFYDKHFFIRPSDNSYFTAEELYHLKNTQLSIELLTEMFIDRNFLFSKYNFS